MAFTTLVRQNGFLLTLPLGLLAAGCYFHRQKKGVLTGALCCLGCLALIQGGLYSRLDIVYPDNTLEEAVGLPMTLLCNARQREPGASGWRDPGVSGHAGRRGRLAEHLPPVGL